MQIKSNKGFTLVEMIITLTVMSVIASAALPRVINIVGGAKKGARDKIVGAVRSGIGLVRLGTIDDSNPFGNLPAQLDTAANGDCSSSNSCFDNVLEPGHGITDSKWRKISATTYDHNPGPDVAHYSYSQANATFDCIGGTCM